MYHGKAIGCYNAFDIENEIRLREMDIAAANDPDHVDYETEARAR